jgi:hypothetical protein
VLEHLARTTVRATALRAAGIEYLDLPQMGNPRDNRDSYRNVDAQTGRDQRELSLPGHHGLTVR